MSKHNELIKNIYNLKLARSNIKRLQDELLNEYILTHNLAPVEQPKISKGKKKIIQEESKELKSNIPKRKNIQEEIDEEIKELIYKIPKQEIKKEIKKEPKKEIKQEIKKEPKMSLKDEFKKYVTVYVNQVKGKNKYKVSYRDKRYSSQPEHVGYVKYKHEAEDLAFNKWKESKK